MLAVRAVALVVLVLGLLSTGVEAASPRPGVFAGSLGIKVPKGAHATVRAVDAASGVVVAAKDVRRAGTFSLRLPAGPYVVRGVVVPRRGRAIAKAIAVSLRPGQRRRAVKLTARKRRAVRRRARAAFVTERGNVRLGTVAVGIHQLSYSGRSPNGDLGMFSQGFSDLLITDVLDLVERRCPRRVALREVARLADVLREFELGESPYADKSTFPKRNLIILDANVRGTFIEGADGSARVKLTITDDRTGAKLGDVDAPLGADVFAGEQAVAGQLTDKLCALSETFEVTLDVRGEGRFATHDASGTMHSVLRARRSGETWTDSGPLQWQNVGFASKTDCAYVDVVVPAIAWSVTITDTGSQLMVAWSRSGNDSTTASVDCPGDPFDPPPIPGQPGPSLLNTGPESFTLPYTGGTMPISDVVQDGGDGFFDAGTISVEPAGITASR
jgi:hypothetical protein